VSGLVDPGERGLMPNRDPGERGAMPDRRVAITGLGIVSPLGCGVETNWQALREGRSGVGPITQPAPEGIGASEAMRLALADAGLHPTSIGYVNAHGTSTAHNDATETLAIKHAFGEHAHRLAVSSTKSMTGHLLGAAGALEAAYTALALERQLLPPTINYEEPDPQCDLDYVPNHARPLRFDAALSSSFGFGGANAAVVLRRGRERATAA
jgi:3-oxoacyl-(acyl-carrier-protein) synthase